MARNLNKWGCLCVLEIVSAWAGEASTPINPGKVLEFKISKSGLTRVSIDNDTIDDVYAFPGEPDLVTHHKSGHVFITPSDLEIPLCLTVITRRGLAQDLRLTPSPQKAEPIVLHVEEPKPAPQSPKEAYAAMLSQFISGKIPEGFYRTQSQEACRGKEALEAIVDQAYQNGQVRVVVFRIKNETSDRHALDNRVFWGEGDLASAFDRSTLAPQETARLFIIQHI